MKWRKTATQIKQNTQKGHIPTRLNILFFIVFILFVALIVQLSYLQLMKKDLFISKIEATQKKSIEGSTPRGMIYDASGEVLVGNEPNQAILFTKKPGMSAEEMLTTSYMIQSLIDVPQGNLTERDKKDFYLANPEHLKALQATLTEQDKKDDKGQERSESELYQILLDRVPDDALNFDEASLQAASIFKKINSAYAMTPVFIKNRDVTDEEIAIIGENINQIPGISTGLDWERSYPQGDFLKPILGTITDEQAGLPAEYLDAYLAQGYARNDRVGNSYLEKMYEPVLRGTKSQSEVILDKGQNIIHQEEIYPGEKGKNLVLTINQKFQEEVQDILNRNYQQLIGNGKAEYSPGAYAVVLNPKNGDVLAMAGIDHDVLTGEQSEDPLGTINKAFVPGSAIKGATIMAGFEHQILKGNDVLIDEPIQLSQSAVKRSLFNAYDQVPIDAVQALALSSNVYMMKIALGILGVTYKPGMTLPIDTQAFDTLRSTYEQFGLGTSTGIDLPGESTGLVSKNYLDKKGNIKSGVMANFLDLSYGNFDTYTPMQLAQYVSTIANDGIRVAPHIVEGVYQSTETGALGALDYKIEPKVLNQIDQPEAIDIIQQGFYEVVNGTDARRTGKNLQGTPYHIAAKTGTAETFYIPPNDPNAVISVVNSTLVAYAPSEDPEVALSVVLPQIKDDKDKLNMLIAKEIFNAYFNFYHP